jgi:hypothetical protein
VKCKVGEEEGLGDKSERRGNTVQEPNRKDAKEKEGVMVK